MNNFNNPGINNYNNTGIGFPTVVPNPMLQNNLGNFNHNNSFPGQYICVNGMDSAKAYPTQPNSKVILFDSEKDIFYAKETDASNFPTIKAYRFEEITDDVLENSDNAYVTKSEFEKFKEELLNGKQFVSKQSTNSTNSSRNNSNKKHDGHA